MRIYHRGGNAVDAGVAAMLAAAVTEFSHFGLGGEAPILVRTRDGKVHALAGVGPMPKLATAEFFRNRRLLPGELTNRPEPDGLKGMVPVAGLMPALVPGMIEAALVALREYGTKSFAEVAQPAIELADGFPIDETRCGAIERGRRFLEPWPTSRAVFLPGGRVPRPGDIFRQPDLARTLRAMAAENGRYRRRARLTSTAARSPAASTPSAAPTRACCATRTWPPSASSPRRPPPPPTAASRSTSPASGARAPRCSKR